MTEPAEVRVAVVETKLTTIHDDLQEIKKAFNTDLSDLQKEMSSTKKWLIVTLSSVILSASSLSFWVGAWKGQVDEKISILQTALNHHESESKERFQRIESSH